MANRIRKLRKMRNLSQKDFGELLFLAPSTVALYESGKRKPNCELLKTMAQFFNTSVDYILGFTNVPAPYGKIKPEQMRLLKKTSKLPPEVMDKLDEHIDMFLKGLNP